MGSFHLKKILTQYGPANKSPSDKEKENEMFRVFLRNARILNVLGREKAINRWRIYVKGTMGKRFEVALWKYKGREQGKRGRHYEPIKYGFTSTKEFLMPENWTREER